MFILKHGTKFIALEVLYLHKSFVRKIAIFITVFLVTFSTIILPLGDQAFASNFGRKVSAKKETLTGGVTLNNEVYQGNSQRIVANYLKADLKHSDVSIQVAMANPINSMAKVTDFAKRETRQGHYVVGATNASFYEIGTGYPANLVVQNNQILNYGRLSATQSNPNYYRYAFGIDANGNPKIRSYDIQMNAEIGGQTFTVGSLNLERINHGIALFTPAHRYKTVSKDDATLYATEIVVTNTTKDPATFSFGDRITGTVSAVYPYGQRTNATIPQGGFVLSANGKELANKLKDVQPGDEITISASVSSHWMNSQVMLQTGPLLVADGKVNISMNLNSSFAREISPRTAVGITKNNEIIMVAVDGRQPGYSNGMTIRQLAEYMVSLGAQYAINLDGGGSTSIAAWRPGTSGIRLINRPSDGVERRAPNSLQIISKKQPPSFKDISTHWAFKEIVYLADQKIIGGFPDGTFGPNLNITREQAVALLVRELKINTANRKAPNFKDVRRDNTFAYDEIAAAVEEGLIVGKTKDRFDPKGPLTRAEAAAILQRAYKITGAGGKNFPDVPSSHWAYEPIMSLSSQNIAGGLPDGTFAPSKQVTRAEFSVFLYRIMMKK